MTMSNPGSRGRIVAALLAGVIAILTAVTIALYLTQRAPSSSPTPALPPAKSTPTATTPGPDINTSAADQGHSEDLSQDHDVADADKASWEPVLLGFAKNFTNTSGGPARWRTRLSPFVVAAVEEQLSSVHLDKVPAGHFDSYEVLTPGSYQIAVKVTYREGWALVLYLTTDGVAWSVTNYDRFLE